MLIPVYAGSVNRWECDENDHLNVRFFAQKMQQTLQFGLVESGLATQANVDQACRGIVHQHMRHQAEARIAVPITGFFGLIEFKPDQIQVLTELRNTATDAILATYLINITGEFGTPDIPTLDCPDYAAPRGVDAKDFFLEGRSAAELKSMGCNVIGRGVVQPEECDADGFMQIYMYMGRNSDSMPNLFSQFEEAERGNGVVGGAVLEYRLNRFGHLRRGSRFELISGVKSLGEKTQTFIHVLFDVDTGQLITGSEAVAISMDLVARKSIPIPPERRARMEKLLIKV